MNFLLKAELRFRQASTSKRMQADSSVVETENHESKRRKRLRTFAESSSSAPVICLTGFDAKEKNKYHSWIEALGGA